MTGALPYWPGHSPTRQGIRTQRNYVLMPLDLLTLAYTAMPAWWPEVTAS